MYIVNLKYMKIVQTMINYKWLLIYVKPKIKFNYS